MNQKYIIAENSLENFKQGESIAGYQFRIRIPYYMGAPLSQIEHIRAKIDTEPVEPQSMRVVASSGEEFTMEEIKTVYTFFWEYGEKLLVKVYKENGLAAGAHRLDVDVAVDVIYAPKGFGTSAYKNFVI